MATGVVSGSEARSFLRVLRLDSEGPRRERRGGYIVGACHRMPLGTPWRAHTLRLAISAAAS